MSGAREQGRTPVGPRVAAGAATLAVTLGLVPVVSGTAWLLEVTVVVGLVAVTGVVAAELRASAAVVSAAQLGVIVVVLTVVHAPAQAVLGLFPGPAAWRQLMTRVGEAVSVVQTQAAPIDADPGIRLALAAGAGGLAIIVDLFVVAARSPALAGLPLLAVHAVGAVFAPAGLSAAYFLLAVAALVVLLLALPGGGSGGWGPLVLARPGGSSRAPRWVPGLAAVGVTAAVTTALVLPAVVDLPTRLTPVSGGTSAQVGGSTAYLNPLLDLRNDLTAPQDTVVLRYTTDQRRPQPLRIVTVDTFTGDVWEPGPVDTPTSLEPGEPMPAAPGTTEDTPATAHTMSITIEALRQQWLPLPYPASAIDVEGEWLVDADSLNVIASGDGRTRQDQRYDVEYRQVDPDPAQLAAAPPPPDEVVQRYAQTPTGLPAVIAQTAADVVAAESTAYDQAVALQEWFRGDGGFRYTLSAPNPESGSALADFLTAKEGYCVHFASTMAVMARTLGIPARVAVGFLPGTRTADGGWEVTVADAHAWPELYFEGAGWVRFEPTPGRRAGQAPAWTVEDPTPGTPPQEGTSASASPSPAPSTTLQQSPGLTEGSADNRDQGRFARVRVAALVLAGLVGAGGLLLLPRAARTLRSERRWRRAVSDADRAEAAWADLLEQLGDLGVELPASATPRQVGQRLTGLEGPGDPAVSDAEPVRRVVRAVEHSRYGVGAPSPRHDEPGGVQVMERPVALEPTDLRGDARAIASDLARRASPGAVRRWRWWPASGARALRTAPTTALRLASTAARLIGAGGQPRRRSRRPPRLNGWSLRAGRRGPRSPRRDR